MRCSTKHCVTMHASLASHVTTHLQLSLCTEPVDGKSEPVAPAPLMSACAFLRIAWGATDIQQGARNNWDHLPDPQVCVCGPTPKVCDYASNCCQGVTSILTAKETSVCSRCLKATKQQLTVDQDAHAAMTAQCSIAIDKHKQACPGSIAMPGSKHRFASPAEHGAKVWMQARRHSEARFQPA